MELVVSTESQQVIQKTSLKDKTNKNKIQNPTVLAQVTWTLQYFVIMLMFSVTSQLEHKYRKHRKKKKIKYLDPHHRQKCW